MIKEKDAQVISHFRNNARQSLTKLSRRTKIPISTIFDKLKEYEKKNYIMKHTALLDFKKLGFDIRTQVLLTANKDNREELQSFLINHKKINTVFRVNNGYDFLIEGIFETMQDLDVFTRQLDEFVLKEKKEFFIMEDIKREEFMTFKENIGIQR